MADMPRRRVHNLGLPPRLYLRHGTYFYDARPGWQNLGQDYHLALSKYAKLIARKSVRNTVGALLDEYLNVYLRRNPVEPSTMQSYRILAEHIRREWQDCPLERVTRGDCQRFLDLHPRRPTAVNVMRFFKLVLARGVAWEWIPASPMEHVKFPPLESRKRTLSDDERERIRAHLLPKLRVIADLAYLLSARVSEVAQIRWDDVRDGVLYMRRRKTKDVQPFTVTPELQALLDEARRLETTGTRPMISPYLLTTERRKPFDPRYVSQAFSAAARAAGVEDVRFHDQRRSSLNADRATAQERAGHADARTTRTYMTGRDPVMPLKGKK
jgi:integrase